RQQSGRAVPILQKPLIIRGNSDRAGDFALVCILRYHLMRHNIINEHRPSAGSAMADHAETKEPQYGLLFDVKKKHGIARFGLMANESWNQDPKRTLFTLARYKFVAKMLAG